MRIFRQTVPFLSLSSVAIYASIVVMKPYSAFRCDRKSIASSSFLGMTILSVHFKVNGTLPAICGQHIPASQKIAIPVFLRLSDSVPIMGVTGIEVEFTSNGKAGDKLKRGLGSGDDHSPQPESFDFVGLWKSRNKVPQVQRLCQQLLPEERCTRK